MLVLTRRKDEVIQIGDSIRLHVVAINRRSVKLAFEAPPDVPIHRGEVRQRIDAERITALPPPEQPAVPDETLPA
jgi:carbon storage regulator